MNKSQLSKLVGMRLRLLPVPVGPNGTPLEDDWLIHELRDDAIVFQTVGGAHTVVVGHDSTYGYTSEPGRNTDIQKYGCIQLVAQIEIGRDGRVRVTPLPPRPSGTLLPSLIPLMLTDGSMARSFSWRGRDPVHLLSEEAPRQLGTFFVPLCDALRAETSREPEFQSRDRLNGDIVYELTPDHRARWQLLGGMGGQPGTAILVLTEAPARNATSPSVRQSSTPVPATRPPDVAVALLQLHKTGVHDILNVSAPVDPLQRDALQQHWIPLAQAWDAQVVAALKTLGCTPEEIHFVETFPLPTLRRIDFLYPMNSQWSISDIRRERLEKVIDRYLERPIFGVASAPQATTTTLAVFEWQEGDPADSRIEYRDWVNFVFRITGTKKERVRAFLEIARDGKPSASRRNAEIAGYDWHRHEVPDLRPGEQYAIPAILQLTEPVNLWLDEQRYNHLVTYEPDTLLPGSYLTDSAFLDGMHRQLLAPGTYRVRAVIAIGDSQHLVEHESDWRVVTVP